MYFLLLGCGRVGLPQVPKYPSLLHSSTPLLPISHSSYPKAEIPISLPIPIPPPSFPPPAPPLTRHLSARPFPHQTSGGHMHIVYRDQQMHFLWILNFCSCVYLFPLSSASQNSNDRNNTEVDGTNGPTSALPVRLVCLPLFPHSPLASQPCVPVCWSLQVSRSQVAAGSDFSSLSLSPFLVLEAHCLFRIGRLVLY